MDSEGWRWMTTVGEIVPVGRDSKDETRGPSRFPKRTFFDAMSAEESDETKTSATEKNKTQNMQQIYRHNTKLLYYFNIMGYNRQIALGLCFL